MNDIFEFNSLNDWGRIDAELRRSLRALHDFGSKKQLAKMLDNLQHAVTELSKSEIDYRRTMNSTVYLAKLAIVREQLVHLQQWLMFATLIDTNPEQ